MLAKLLAWPAIVLGVIWALNPEFLRNGLTRRTNWKLSWLALGTLFFPLFKLGRIAGIAGVLLIFILFWAAMTRAHTAVRDIFLKTPLYLYRAVGIINIVGGVLILRLR